MGLVEIRARLSALIGEIMPAGISGVVFPSSGSEANECAIAMARRFTGRTKIISAYRSYHGGTAASSAATGDFRRHFLPAALSASISTPVLCPFAPSLYPVLEPVIYLPITGIRASPSTVMRRP